MRFKLLFSSIFLILAWSNSSPAEEVFNKELEELHLKNIRQLTFPYMGFEKAGEAYFSADDSTILLQAVPTGKTTYQIFKMDLQKSGYL